MGWWDVGVLSGDTPLDILDGLMSALGIDEDTALEMYPLDEITTDQATALRGAFEGHDPAKLAQRFIEYDAEIAPQVVAVAAMAAGVDLGDLAELAVAAATTDRWAATDARRRAAMEDLVAKIEAYDGCPTTVRSATLGDRLAEAFSSGQ